MITVKNIISFYFRFILRRPHLINRVSFFIPGWRELWQTCINELFFLFRLNRSFRITSVIVELSGKCNLDCVMCARHHAMTREQGQMTWETFTTLVELNPDIGNFILVGWGEMMLNPEFFRMVAYLKERNKRIALTTNATLLTPDRIEKIIQSGISHITLSVDGLDHVYQSLRGIPFGKVENNIIALSKRIRETGAEIYLETNSIGSPEVLAQEEEMRQRLGPYLDDLRFSSFLEYNQMLKTNRTSPCREFWRGMISVFYDGHVVPCCMDYNASMVLGHVSDGPLIKLWNNAFTRQLRSEQIKLIFKNRCATCYESDPPEESRVNKRFS